MLDAHPSKDGVCFFVRAHQPPNRRADPLERRAIEPSLSGEKPERPLSCGVLPFQERRAIGSVDVAADFEFELDTPKRLLTIRLHGFWDMPTVEGYGEALPHHLRQLRRLPPPRACLVDARDFAIQARAVADRQAEIVTEALPLYPERTARVVSSAISHKQAARMSASSSHRVFDGIEPALSWLLEN